MFIQAYYFHRGLYNYFLHQEYWHGTFGIAVNFTFNAYFISKTHQVKRTLTV